MPSVRQTKKNKKIHTEIQNDSNKRNKVKRNILYTTSRKAFQKIVNVNIEVQHIMTSINGKQWSTYGLI